MHDQLQIRRDLARLLSRVGQLEAQLEQFRRVRSAQKDLFKQIRWAVTCEPLTGSYPAEGDVPAAFPIKFLDAHFPATVGSQTLDTEPRSDEQIAVAWSESYLAVGTERPVFWLRGLGPDGDEGEFFLFPAGGSSSTPQGIPFVNNANATIPPYAVMWNAGNGIVVDSGTAYVDCRKPATTFDIHWLVNGSTPLPYTAPNTDFSRGFWRFEDSGPVAVDASLSGQVQVGDRLGVAPGSWYLQKDRPGFIALGPTRTQDGVLVVDCRQRAVDTVFGKAYADATQNAAGTTSIDFKIWFRRSTGTLVDAGWDTITTYLMFPNKNERVQAGTWGRADYHTDYWEGDFACDVDDRDTGQQSPGAQEQQFFFHGPDPGETDPIQLIQNGTV